MHCVQCEGWAGRRRSSSCHKHHSSSLSTPPHYLPTELQACTQVKMQWTAVNFNMLPCTARAVSCEHHKAGKFTTWHLSLHCQLVSMVSTSWRQIQPSASAHKLPSPNILSQDWQCSLALGVKWFCVRTNTSLELVGGCLLQKLQWKSVPKMVMTISTVMTAIEEVITGTTAPHTVVDRIACESQKQRYSGLQQQHYSGLLEKIRVGSNSCESDLPGAIIWRVQSPRTATFQHEQF